MKRPFLIILACVLALSLPAQTKKTTRKVTTQKSVTQTRKATPAKRKAKAPVKQTGKQTTKQKYSTPSIKGLEKQRTQIQQQIRVQEQALKANQADVKKRLENLLVLNTAIEERQKSIEGIQKDITQIDGDIEILKAQLSTLESQLKDRKLKYVQSMRYMARYRKVQDKMMFIFSAKNFAEMFRRIRFVHQYADYQKAQGELVKSKQDQVTEKYQQLEQARGQKNALLSKDKKERIALEGQQDEQQKMVSSLKQQQKTIQGIIDEQRKKDAALNAQIDRLIAIEVEKARARAEAEAKRKAAAEAAAKKRAEELARKKAAAEAAAKENERRIAEAREREAKAKAEAREAALAAERAKKEETREAALRAAADRKARADQAAREAETARLAAERKAKAEAERSEQEIAAATKSNEEGMRMSTVDRMLSGGFEANKGRLPMPITGAYKIVSRFGQNTVEGLKHVTLDNKGINILGKPGCMARSIYDGEVSAVFGFSGTMVVMVRHGSYISVYCNLKSVSVTKGQKVSTGQALGSIANDNILQFQLRKQTAKLNPEPWLRK
ncbi:MAG: peptidoglycan DD-metalloendopeptidase family protein [Prevotella sp.]|nr:peptidoglycan DD-metalloendopeptidase family protein [Prevotella sp.]MBQ6208325.1 peptidoglycan DD-metalloendopeptidase family protein [Prevotella sp.]